MYQWDDAETQTPIDDGTTPVAGNWWEGPRPSYVPATAPWPPPLPPGASYGPNPGQIIYAPGTQPTNAQQPQPGVDTPVTGDQPHYYPKPHDPTIDPGPAAPPVPGPGGGTLTAPFTGTYTPATPDPLPTLDIPQFVAPSIADAMDDGYKFTLDQGNQNLQNWAAARGTLNDSSTAKALIDYGQGAAATQYGNVWNRAYNTWQTGTRDPAMKTYETNAANVSHLNDVHWQDAWNTYLQSFRQFQDQRDSTFDKQFKVATA